MSCRSRCPRDPSERFFQVQPYWTSETSYFAATFSDRASWLMLEQATGMSFSCRCGLFGIWWGETCCASNSLELVQPFMPLRHDLTTVPVKGIIARILGFWNWVLFIIYLFWFCLSPTSPHLVPNSPRVPLRNVSWGLGVCAVLGQVRFSV